MTASEDELHRLVDQLPEGVREEARRRLTELLDDPEAGTVEFDGEDRPLDGLLELAGSARGPRDLSSEHDRYSDPAS